MKNVASIFERYEAVRHRLPRVQLKINTVEIDSLLDIAADAEAFVFDAFGVLNVGDTPIPGAADRLDQLRRNGCKIRILTNAASYDRAAAAAKFRNLGMKIETDEIITSRDATLACLDTRLWGCVAAQSDALSDMSGRVCRLEDDPADYARVDGVLFLSTQAWTNARQAVLERALLERPRPLMIANADLVAPRNFGFSLEPGYFGHLLADRGVSSVRFFGKPFPEVFQLVEKSLQDVPSRRIVMCGDTLHTDIVGAAARGWRTALVTRDGLFSGFDTQIFCERSDIHPDWRVARI